MWARDGRGYRYDALYSLYAHASPHPHLSPEDVKVLLKVGFTFPEVIKYGQQTGNVARSRKWFPDTLKRANRSLER